MLDLRNVIWQNKISPNNYARILKINFNDVDFTFEGDITTYNCDIDVFCASFTAVDEIVLDSEPKTS